MKVRCIGIILAAFGNPNRLGSVRSVYGEGVWGYTKKVVDFESWLLLLMVPFITAV
jgi:hypothetical protein